MWRHSQALLLLLLSFSSAQRDPLQSQIVGGHEAKAHSRPYMAYLSGLKTNCGGFLVAPQWVMTAAHCNDTYTVILGAHNITVEEPSQQVFTVEANHPHPEYNKYTYYSDIRLLKLNSKATLNEYVSTLRLPTFNDDLANGTPCSVAGWGLVYKDWIPETLYETNVTIYGRWECGKLYADISDANICAGRPDEPEDSSQGDSGGPLVCNGVAQGIVSYGYSCPPGVYTRVAHYLPWIKKTMRK
ncbi:mast cell protease 1A-like [Lacerta agilis]|uniref:mast cell protease 1A-like n=1 Tax=Lacerta agilis TaxID=80427 RepID=UPI0014199F54|nr:mast cell protease 1A-like [Lacerta agilis]